MAVYVMVSDGSYIKDGEIIPSGNGVGRIEFDPANEYSPPVGINLVKEEDFSGDYFERSKNDLVPDSVDAWKIKVVLQKRPGKAGASFLDDANALAKASGGVADIAWSNAPSITRTSPLLNQMASALGLTEADIDAIFIEADAFVA